MWRFGTFMIYVVGVGNYSVCMRKFGFTSAFRAVQMQFRAVQMYFVDFYE